MIFCFRGSFSRFAALSGRRDDDRAGAKLILEASKYKSVRLLDLVDLEYQLHAQQEQKCDVTEGLELALDAKRKNTTQVHKKQTN